jgi:site-specific recombinase XerD
MLEQFFIRPETVDRIRSSWIGGAIEQYVTWMSGRKYAAPTVCRRIPILMRFGEFSWDHGARNWAELPDFVADFVAAWQATRCHPRHSQTARHQIAKDVRIPVEQMLRLVVSEFRGTGRPHRPPHPFLSVAPGFFPYLVQERGLRQSSLKLYGHHLRQFAVYLEKIGLHDLRHLSPPVLSGFVIDLSRRVVRSSVRNACGILHVFLGYLYRERILPKNLSSAVEAPQTYRLAKIPRAITWDEVRRLLESIDRRAAVGRRDYAILLLLVTYGLRAREVAALTLDDIDWRQERLRIPERKAGHSTAYPLSPTVGQAIVDYLQNGRPQTADRHVFFRVVAPPNPITEAAVSSRAAHYLHKIGISVPRAGSHTLRHTCVQRLVDAEFDLKIIGDYVGHRSTASTEIYTKVAIEKLREVACGDGEEVL